MSIYPLAIALTVGFSHAFEADHLVAVSSIVTHRKNWLSAAKDGFIWGLGHTTTILLIGVMVLIGKTMITSQTFIYFEACVGVMLIIIGFYRLYQLYRENHTIDKHDKLAYGVGLIHGLAGSGALLLLVMSEFKSASLSMMYLAVFGFGSSIGMLIAASVLSLPFSKKVILNGRISKILIWLSSLLCIGYGVIVVFENIMI